MVRNIAGGKGHKRIKNRVGTQTNTGGLILRDGDSQNYGQVTKALGYMRFKLLDRDGKELIGKLRGSLRSRTRLKVGDIVLYSCRDTTDDNKVDIIMKYSSEQAKRLLRAENIVFPGSDEAKGRTDIVFDEDSEEQEKIDNGGWTLKGIDRIMKLYEDYDSDEDEEDEEDDEDSEAEEDSEGEEDADADEENDAEVRDGDEDTTRPTMTDEQRERAADLNEAERAYKKQCNSKAIHKSRHEKIAGRSVPLLDNGDIDIDKI